MAPGKVNRFLPPKFDFQKILKTLERIFQNPRTFIVLFCKQEKMFTIEIEDGAKRPESPVPYISIRE